MKKLIGSVLLLSVFAFSGIPEKTTVFLVGDSTMSVKEINAYPETGWGMPFAHFFDSTIEVDNRAMNGRSTGSFIAEKRWTAVMDKLKQGDYVYIQFGHNDEVPTKKSYTTPTVFVENLSRFVSDVRSRNAFPILITPVARRKFDDKGQIEETHAEYSALVRKLAQDLQVPLIDLDKESQALLQNFGADNSKWLFNQLKPGEHPNYPNGKEDNTHFSELGARLMAEIVLADTRKLNLPLADHIYKGKR